MVPEKRQLEEEKNLQLERLVFFSDAVVAIAITLLALEIKIGHTEGEHLQFSDIWKQGKTFLAFFLSFFNIANFWKINASFFSYIRKLNEKLMWFNIGWLLFIVLLPFSTSLVSNYFSDVPAMSIYCLNISLIAIFQNLIWDYASDKQLVDPEKLNGFMDSRLRIFCNLDMFNSLIGFVVSFFSPRFAFILLFTKLPMFVIMGIYYRRQRKAGRTGNAEA